MKVLKALLAVLTALAVALTAALPFRLGDAFCARRVLLLVLVDLDIVGGVSVLHKEKRAGECGG